MRQSSALDILKTGQNVFLTGSAGSGKTYTLNQYIDYLRARRVPVAVTASTGIAATHMNGTTIHSWSGIGIKDELTDYTPKVRVEIVAPDEVAEVIFARITEVAQTGHYGDGLVWMVDVERAAFVFKTTPGGDKLP